MIYGDITYATLTGGGNGGNAYQVRLGYQVLSENISNNSREVKLQLEVRSVKSAYGSFGFNQTTTIDNVNVGTNSFDMRNTNVWQVFGSRTITINGAYNGTKTGSFTTDATTSSGNYTLKSGSASVYISLASLHRLPELTLSSISENSSKLSGVSGTTFVNNISEKTFTLNYTMYDSATASSLKIYDKNGNELTATTSLGTTSGTIVANFKTDPISSNAITNNKTTFTIKFMDNLNGTTTITTPEYAVIPYFAPNLITTASNVKRNGQTTGKAILNLTGQFYNATVGNTANIISLSFKYWAGSTEPSTYYPITIDNEKVIVSGNNITANKYEFKKNNVVVDDLDKSNSYKFKIKAVDSFGSEYEAEIELTLAKGEWIMAKFKDRIDFKKITVGGYNPFQYSNEEIICGIWVDDKPIYRKVFNFTSPSNGNENILATLSYIDNIVSPIKAVIINSSNGQINFPYYFDASNFGNIWFNKANKNIGCQVSSPSYQNQNIIAILEYTKTTD